LGKLSLSSAAARALGWRRLGERWRTGASSFARRFPYGRVVGPADVAALAVHLMINTALTGATYDIDGGQQFVGA
jgi:NAD(P)-dependent dehydrogenase (short-subunit alcohol dehydrogenase family)